MKIGFITRKNHHVWGGDLGVVDKLARGLCELGFEAVAAPTAFDLHDADLLVLTNSTVDQRTEKNAIDSLGKPYAVLGFHEDILAFYSAATGMENYVLSCLGYGFPSDNGLDFSIEQLIEMPHIVHYYGSTPKRSSFYNYKIMSEAAVCIANSRSEAAVMQRDCPPCKTAVVPVAPGLVTGYRGLPDESFLDWTGLSSKSYVLQVGRLELRKNQFSTILAMRNLEMPLVFIATRAFNIKYETACVETALKWRKAPTIFVSQNLQPFEQGSVKVLPYPGEERLPKEMLLSAYYHAGLHLHPAFHELPGATFLEAARLGTPTIASSWCTITDYFFDAQAGHSNLDGRIVYTPPHHIQEMETLIPQMFGKSFAPLEDHPSITYSELDSARDFARALVLLNDD